VNTQWKIGLAVVGLLVGAALAILDARNQIKERRKGALESARAQNRRRRQNGDDTPPTKVRTSDIWLLAVLKFVPLVLVFISAVSGIIDVKRKDDEDRRQKQIAQTKGILDYNTTTNNDVIMMFGSVPMSDIREAVFGEGEDGFNIRRMHNKLIFNISLKKPKPKGAYYGILRNWGWQTIDLDNVDYNYDKSGFEMVRKGDHKVLFQFDLKGDTANIKGTFIDGNIYYYVGEDGAFESRRLPQTDCDEVFIAPETYYIQRLFKYPHDLDGFFQAREIK
jgi:hypothetical protein